MDRRSLVAGVALLLAGPASGQTQQAERVPQVGVMVVSEPASPTEPNVSAFRQALRDLGYVEGKNIAVQYRYAHGRMERVPELVAELVRLNVNVLVASGPSTVAAKNATRTIPIVFVAMADPVGFGIVASLARPGGNLTGLSFMLDTDFTGKWMELLKEAAPGISRVTYLRDANIPLPVPYQPDLRAAAERLGLTFQHAGVRHLGEMDGIFSATTRDRRGSLIVSPAPLFLTHRRQIIELASKHRAPTIYGFRAFVDDGGLMSYGVSLPDVWHRAATYVDKILKGARPADLPVEQPTKFELVINLKAAKALGLTVPASLLLRADQVIE